MKLSKKSKIIIDYIYAIVFAVTCIIGYQVKADDRIEEKTINENIEEKDVYIGVNNISYTYDGSEFDVSKLFEIPDNAGEALYFVKDKTYGDIPIETSMLKITKPGEYKIEVKTVSKNEYKEGRAIATLIINDTESTAVLEGTNLGSNNWYKGDVTIKAPEGYKICSSNANLENGKDSILIKSDMNSEFSYWLKDDKGFISEKKKIYIKRDTSKSMVSVKVGKNLLSQTSYYTAEPTLSVMVSEEQSVESGISTIKYQIDNESARYVFNNYTDSLLRLKNFNIAIKGDGSHTVKIYVKDQAGNETIKLVKVKVKTTFSVKLNYNGGIGTRASISVSNGKKYGIFPKAQKRKYQFVGWYTKKIGGKKVNSNSRVNLKEDQILFAHWNKVLVSNKIKVTGLKQKKGKIKIKVKKAKQATGFIIYCSYSKKFKSAKTIDVVGKKKKEFMVKKVLKKAKQGWTYYYRIRPYIIDSTGKKVWGKKSKIYAILYKS